MLARLLPRRNHRVVAGLTVALVLSACGGATDQSSRSGQPKQLLLVSYAVTKGAYDRILPVFRAEWKSRTGEDLDIRTSYGASGSQSRAIIDGLEADVAGLALGADINRLQLAGLIEPGWENELPNRSIITHSTVALLTRAGNPKGIKGWSDLRRNDVEVVSANPRTSGGARWNFLGLWGSITQSGGNDAQAKAYVGSVFGNIRSLPKDAREASDVFLKRNQGDVLLNYENEAILATRTGDLKAPFLIPDPNIRIDGPIAVVDRNVDRRGTRKEAEALASFLMSAPAQRIFAEEGFRPVNPEVWSKVKGRFAPIGSLFTVEDFGGWANVESTFFSAGGIWDQLFDKVRR